MRKTLIKTAQMQLGHKVIDYDITYKDMKSIRMRVKDGRLKVSAPYQTSQTIIEKSLKIHQDKLMTMMETYEGHGLYQDRGYVDIFGKRYTLLLRDMRKYRCEKHGKYIYVYHANMKKCVDMYLRQVLLAYIETRIAYYVTHEFSLMMPQIEIKKYTGRWGSCFYHESRVSFNFSLVHIDTDLIDYVVVHELTHFLQNNHSPLFYQELEKRLPDYKSRQKRLKETHI